MSGKVVLREKKGLPGPQHRLLYPEPEPELEPLATQIPEAPTPDVPVWNIEAFTLLDGKLVLLGNEDEVRGPHRQGKGKKGREQEEQYGSMRGITERCLPLLLSVFLPFLTIHSCWGTGSSPAPDGER